MYAITFNDNVLFVTDEEFGNKFLKEFEEYQKNIHKLKQNIREADDNIRKHESFCILRMNQDTVGRLIQKNILDRNYEVLSELNSKLDDITNSIKEYRSEILDPLNNNLEEYLKTVPNIHKKFINYVDNINHGCDSDSDVFLEKLNEYNDFETMMERKLK